MSQLDEKRTKRLTKAIEGIREDAKQLEAKAVAGETRHGLEFGGCVSELANPPLEIESYRDMAAQLREYADFLSKVKDGHILLSTEEETMTHLVDVNKRMADLAVQKKEAEKTLRMFKLLREIIYS